MGRDEVIGSFLVPGEHLNTQTDEATRGFKAQVFLQKSTRDGMKDPDDRTKTHSHTNTLTHTQTDAHTNGHTQRGRSWFNWRLMTPSFYPL